jgi:hypothetical protein
MVLLLDACAFFAFTSDTAVVSTQFLLQSGVQRAGVLHDGCNRACSTCVSSVLREVVAGCRPCLGVCHCLAGCRGTGHLRDSRQRVDRQRAHLAHSACLVMTHWWL